MDDCEQGIRIAICNVSPLNDAPRDDTSDSLTVFEVLLELKVAHCSTKVRFNFSLFKRLSTPAWDHQMVFSLSKQVIQPACITDSFL
jgi:hypothetical protein